jgi:hypothetical protein
VPVATQQVAHRRAGTDLRQALVFFLGKHGPR